MANPELMTMLWMHLHELLGDWDRHRFTESESEVFAPAQARAATGDNGGQCSAHGRGSRQPRRSGMTDIGA
jgi:hypothetical protein